MLNLRTETLQTHSANLKRVVPELGVGAQHENGLTEQTVTDLNRIRAEILTNGQSLTQKLSIQSILGGESATEEAQMLKEVSKCLESVK
jgi:hypothetical protein